MKNKTFFKKDFNMFIWFILLIFPFFRYTYFTFNYPIVNKIYMVFQVLSFLIIFLTYIKNKNIRFSKINISILIFLIILNFSTFINDANMFDSLYLSFKVITLCLIVEYGLKYHKRIFLKAISCYLMFLVYTNFITVLLYPKGMYIDNIGYYQNWLLGYKNIHILFILPAILFSFLHSYIYYGKLRKHNYLFLIVSIISVILANSSTSLVGLGIVLIFVLFKNLFNKTLILNIKNYVLITGVAFFGIIIFRVQEYFQYFIENILHRSVNFTNRTYIWDYVMDFISAKPWLGYGVEDSVIRYNKTILYQSFHAHNQILEIIYKTGFIGLIVFGIIVFDSIKKLYMNKDHIIVKFISIILFAYLFMMLTEVYSFEYFMFLFVICSNVSSLIGGDNIENNS